MHEDRGDLEKKEDGGKEGARVIPPVPAPPQVQAEDGDDDGEEGAYRRSYWRGGEQEAGTGEGDIRLIWMRAPTMPREGEGDGGERRRRRARSTGYKAKGC